MRRMAKITAKSAEQEAPRHDDGRIWSQGCRSPGRPGAGCNDGYRQPCFWGQEGKGSAPVHHCLSRAGSQGEALCPGERHHGERPAAWVHRLTVRTVLSRSTEPQMIPGKAVLRRRLFLCAQQDDDYDESAGRRNKFQEPTGVRPAAREFY